MLAELVTENTVVATIVEGLDKDEKAKETIKNALSQVKTTFINGNQDNYYYYIYLENKDENCDSH